MCEPFGALGTTSGSYLRRLFGGARHPLSRQKLRLVDLCRNGADRSRRRRGYREVNIPRQSRGLWISGRSKRPVQIRSSFCVASARNTFSVCHLNNHSTFSATPGEQIPRDTYIPTLGAAVSSCPSSNLPFVRVVAHDLTFRRWATAVNVKLMLPPRQSRGVSRLC